MKYRETRELTYGQLSMPRRVKLHTKRLGAHMSGDLANA